MSHIARLKNRIKARLGRIAFVGVDHRRPKIWYGSPYGGFYVDAALLDENSIVYSFGIGEDISFDLDIIRNHGCRVFGFDPTPKSIAWLHGRNRPEGFHFCPFGLGEKTETAKFHLPKNSGHVSGSVFGHDGVKDSDCIEVPLKSFGDILAETGHRNIDLLKMDIEGSEYLVIEDVLSAGVPIRQLLVETHERFFSDGKQKTEKIVRTLREHGYRVFGISDSYREISFVKDG